jgi:hypothetical protein
MGFLGTTIIFRDGRMPMDAKNSFLPSKEPHGLALGHTLEFLLAQREKPLFM